MDKTATRERRGRQAVAQTNTPHPRTFFLKRHINHRVVSNLKVIDDLKAGKTAAEQRLNEKRRAQAESGNRGCLAPFYRDDSLFELD